MFVWEENEAKKQKPSWWFLEGFTDYLTAHPSVREGYARYYMYTQIPVYLSPGNMIAGNLNWGTQQEIFWNNVGSQLVNEELLQKFYHRDDVSAIEKEEVKSRIEQIRPYTLEDMQERLEDGLKAVSISSAAVSTYFNGHMVLDYEQILSIGLGGYRRKLWNKIQDTDVKEKYDFYRGLLITLSGMQEFILRHAQMAEVCLRENRGGLDEEQLDFVICNCKKIWNDPPETFAEALQLIWFMFCFGDYDSYGRFDQYMYPFYERELEGKTEQEQDIIRKRVKELLCDFLKKGEENKGICNMTAGGLRRDGTSGYTEFTGLLMDVIRELGFKSPNLCLRIGAACEEQIFLKAHENLATGQAIPALYNDDVLIPMLLELGYPKEEANNYCLAGCSQVILPGKSNFCCDVGCYNALKTLELTLHGGMDLLQGKIAGLEQEELSKINTFEELYQRYLEQVRYIIDCGVKINDEDIKARICMPATVRTLFTQGCLEAGKSIFQGGAMYNGVQNEIIGLTNVANALTAIKALVFDQKKYGLKELINMADCNYEGYEKERKLLLSQPKFGNDNEEADQIRVRVGMDFYRELGKREGILGGRQWPGEVIFQSHINFAPFTRASLDGRKDYEPLADSAGAMRGTDQNGPTALIKSFCKIPVTAPTVCRNLNLRFPKSLFGKESKKFAALFRSFCALGGVQMQINVLDAKELKMAQWEPEEYKGLIVRIGGYNDYFVDIPKEIQDEVIARTEHGI